MLWLRDIVGLRCKTGDSLTTHSLKTTMLAWVTLFGLMDFSQRRILGHHIDAGLASPLTYGRDNLGPLQNVLVKLLRRVAKGELDPDASRAERIDKELELNEIWRLTRAVWFMACSPKGMKTWRPWTMLMMSTKWLSKHSMEKRCTLQQPRLMAESWSTMSQVFSTSLDWMTLLSAVDASMDFMHMFWMTWLMSGQYASNADVQWAKRLSALFWKPRHGPALRYL